MAEERQNPVPVKIKKYANRRLYNTTTSSYITLDDLAQMIKQGHDFVVHDAKSGEDLTRHVLTQIILEKENTDQNLLPTNFLRDLIKFYDNKAQDSLSQYLDVVMSGFVQNQNAVKDYMNSTFKNMYKFMNVDQIRKKNNEIMANMFSYFGIKSQNEEMIVEQNLVQLKSEIDALQHKLDKISDQQQKSS